MPATSTIPARATGPGYDTAVPDQERPATTYLLEQVIRYEYAGPVRDLRQTLRVVPAAAHGGQRCTDFGIEVRVDGAAAAGNSWRLGADRFGNRIIEATVPAVERAVEFEVWASMERWEGVPECGPAATPGEARRFLRRTARTSLREAGRATGNGSGSGSGDEVAAAATQVEGICSWVHGAMRYEPGSTGVHTTAAEALELGCGVCQDYAHIMLARCRAAGFPARYVSGHLLGEGGSHAWVEVLLPATGGGLRWHAFDPTHDRRTTLDYITVGVGRDYADVAPMSGTYRGPHAGSLTVAKRAVRHPVPQPV